MWSALSPDGELDPDDHRRLQVPENEFPVALPFGLILGRTDQFAVALIGVQAYTTGVTFRLAARARQSMPTGGQRLNDVFWAHSSGAARFLVGVEFADGRRAGSERFPGSSGDIVFHQNGGSGGETSADQDWWLSPLPPAGPLLVIVRCPELGLEETVVELDGTAIRRAGESATVLWPWVPPRQHTPEPPPPPDVPADSWFAR
jgi:hypothetical protein